MNACTCVQNMYIYMGKSLGRRGGDFRSGRPERACKRNKQSLGLMCAPSFAKMHACQTVHMYRCMYTFINMCACI